MDDEPVAGTPDALFPNNWLSTHGNGTAVLYPLAASNRRRERRRDLLRRLRDERGFEVAHIIDLSGWEAQGLFLEGTGSLVLLLVWLLRSGSMTASAWSRE